MPMTFGVTYKQKLCRKEHAIVNDKKNRGGKDAGQNNASYLEARKTGTAVPNRCLALTNEK
jgi:hypothetical protein